MKRLSTGWIIAISIGAAILLLLAWRTLSSDTLPEGFASGNGRIEATEVDIATRMPGRLLDVLVDNGDFVEPGQVVARMDAQQLEAGRRQAEAQLRQAEIRVETVRSQVRQREAERNAALAVLAQRRAELEAAERRLSRTQQLAETDRVSDQVLDDNRAAAHSARAAVSAAEAQIAAAEAATGAAEGQVIEAEAAIDAARAAVESIDADLEDAVLRAPMRGRIQYRLAEPGEVLAAGGRVLNMLHLGTVHMTFFLPTAQAGRVAIGSEARIVLDAAPDLAIPAHIDFVSSVAQFTPRTVETREEREKLMFRIHAEVDRELVADHIDQVKTGLPGRAYVQLDPDMPWPEFLDLRQP